MRRHRDASWCRRRRNTSSRVGSSCATSARALKGVPEPVRAFEVLAELPVRDRVEAHVEAGLTPLVARERELAALEAAFAAAREGRGQVAFVVGEAGLGKSRLLYEFRRRLGAVPYAWLEGRCASYARATGFHPIADALRRGLGISDRDDEAAALATLEHVEAREGGGLGWTLPYLRHLLSLPCGDPEVERLDPATRRSETFRALRARVERAATRGPFVLVVEDLHWIDRASEEFLAYLADAIAGLPALLVLTHRPGYRHPFDDRSYHSRIALQPLSEREMGDMAGAVLEAESLPPELRALIARKAEGNPFFVEEVAKSLLEEGALRRVERRIELARPLGTAAVPDSIHDVLMSRLDRLGDEPKRALQLASVIGREFAVRLLERIHEAGAGLGPLLAELRGLELIHEKAAQPEIAFMFKHALTHDVAYASILAERRKALHRIVGSAIEELYADRLAEHYEALAHHFTEGEDLEKGLHYSACASEKAADVFANEAAAEHCRRALAVAARLGERVPAGVRRALEERLGHVSHLTSAFAASGDAYLRAAALAEGALDRALNRGRAAYTLAWAHDYPRASRAIDEGLGEPRAAEAGAGRAMLIAARGFLHAIGGDLSRSEELLAESAGQTADHPEAVALTCLLEGELAEWRGDYRRALARQGRAIEIARKERLPQYLVPAVWFSGKALCCLGDYSRALATLGEGLAFAERLGYKAAQTRVLNTLGWVHAEVGAHRRAADYNERAVVWARAMVELGLVPGAPELYGNASINLAGNRIALGDLDAAGEILAEIRERVDGETDPWMLWRYRLHLIDAEARLLLGRGDAPAALRAAEAELAGARDHGARKLEARALELRARALLTLDQRPEAEAALRAAAALAEAIGYPPAGWRASALAGELARREGDAAGAALAAARVRAATEATASALADADLARELLALGVGLAEDPLQRACARAGRS